MSYASVRFTGGDRPCHFGCVERLDQPLPRQHRLSTEVAAD
ncbi:hypothetical protein [Nodosilinea sp. FACHB-131]|nr:hypothetical protein [Nodosilinea sp. FACHB-131]